MTKFKVGDEVVCMDTRGSDLEILKHYIVTEVDDEDGTIAFNNDEWFYFGGRFELAPEWAAHQVPVSTENELTLTKLQVKMLQDWKKENIKKVERYEWLRSVGKEQQNVISHYAYEEMDKIIDKLMLLEE